MASWIIVAALLALAVPATSEAQVRVNVNLGLGHRYGYVEYVGGHRYVRDSFIARCYGRGCVAHKVIVVEPYHRSTVVVVREPYRRAHRRW